jgi:hypothetical protein
MFFEPQFYECQAAIFLARSELEVARNVRLPVVGARPATYPEVDALAYSMNGQYVRLVEIKSYPLSDDDLLKVVAKYSRLSSWPVLVIAPSFSPSWDSSRHLRDRKVEVLPFTPDLDQMRSYYEHEFLSNIPSSIAQKIQSGLHHFRYLMPTRSPHRQSRFLNQIDKHIRSVEALRNEVVNRLPVPPARIFWTPLEYRNPKWLYRGEGHPLAEATCVVDLDGTDMHAALTPCRIGSEGTCETCYRVAFNAAALVARDLEDHDYSVSLTLDSGRRGYHLYTEGSAKKYLLSAATRNRHLIQGIRIDLGTLQNRRCVVAFPGSLHGYTSKPIRQVELPSGSSDIVNHLPYLRGHRG